MPKQCEKKRKSNKKGMVNITINIPENYDINIQKLIKMKIIPSRSEGIRTAIREFLQNEQKNLKLLNFNGRKEKSERLPTGTIGGTNFKTKIDNLETKIKGKDNMINYLKAELNKYEKGVNSGNTK
jgi:Arc/MetJ-type ribon-helix-helix transcriptional regulator